MNENQYYVYIITNKSHTLYVGITNDLARRMWEHQQKLVDGFTKQYNINKLIYFEICDDPYVAISREKQIKGWTRKRKIELIKKKNARFEDLGHLL